jgi:DNA invertase Pin-like site-specific DNA recombinase
MSNSDLVTSQHVGRKAVVYVRQSTPHQVLSNQESLRLQYALRERAVELGWQREDVAIIDADLGRTGASAEQRTGFKELLAEVSLGHVGIVLSSEVTRLTRNCSDWYPLLDLCGYKHCLIADREGVYDPGTANGRLLLGLKGTLSEMELFTIRARMTAGLLNKAQRGELALRLPTGLVRDAAGVVQKDPHRDVQDRLELVFSTFLRVRSASRVLQCFNSHQLLLPRQDRFGDIVWKQPTVAAILTILKNPAYMGMFVYGRNRYTHGGPTACRPTVQHLAMEEWRIRVEDVYPAYVSRETFERIQAMLRDNYAEYDRNKTRGVPRAGKALLHGLVACGECGHKMVVQYKGGTRYLCNYLRQQYRVPVCQNLPADPLDAAVVQAFFEALSPVELDAYAQAMAARQQRDEQVERAHQQQVQRLRYQAELAQRQFNQVDPENRLVASELERRWELALRDLQRAEDAAAQAQQEATAAMTPLSADLQAAFRAIGQRLPEVWRQEVLAPQQKKALLRTLIETVVAHRAAPDTLQVRIVWKGGATTEQQVPIPVGSLADLQCGQDLEQQVLERFGAGESDEQIAQDLTTLGYRSPRALAVLPSTVRSIRLRRRRFQQRRQSHPRHVAGFLTVSQLAQAAGVPPHWLYDRIHNGCISIRRDDATGLYLFPDAPTTVRLVQDLLNGTLKTLDFSRGHQHA